MMKKNTKNSLILFSALFLLQLFILRYLINNAAITGIAVSMLVEIAIPLVLAVVIAQLASGDAGCAFKKSLVAGSFLYALYLAVFYDIQINIIMSGMSLFGQSMVSSVWPTICVFAVKVILLAAAVWFAVKPEKIEVVLQEEIIEAEVEAEPEKLFSAEEAQQ